MSGNVALILVVNMRGWIYYSSGTFPPFIVINTYTLTQLIIYTHTHTITGM